MRGRTRITIVGAGNLGTALALSLHGAGCVVDQIVFRGGRASRRKAAALAKRVGARAEAIARVTIGRVKIEAEVVWLCVPDDAIARVAGSLARKADWRKKFVLHSSGALASGELMALRRRGASVASVHPMMTFVAGSQPSFLAVPFAIEGDAAAVRVSRALVKSLGGKAYAIRAQDKVAYHAWATFASPLLTVLLATTEQVAALANINRHEAKARMLPMLRQTLANYAALDAAASFSGPIVRGDVETIRRHLRALGKVPAAKEVYVALARAAMQFLPGKHKQRVKQLLGER